MWDIVPQRQASKRAEKHISQQLHHPSVVFHNDSSCQEKRRTPEQPNRSRECPDTDVMLEKRRHLEISDKPISSEWAELLVPSRRASKQACQRIKSLSAAKSTLSCTPSLSTTEQHGRSYVKRANPSLILQLEPCLRRM